MVSLGTWSLGFEVSAYLVGDILMDTGFSYVREPLLAALADREINLVCCSHNHEDHTGNCAAISAAHGCPVYLRHSNALWEEGVRTLAPYRRIWWGRVEPFDPLEMPEVVKSGGRRSRSSRHRATLAPRWRSTNPTPAMSLLAISSFRPARRSPDLGQPVAGGRVSAARCLPATAAHADRPRPDRRGSGASPRTQGQTHRKCGAKIGRPDLRRHGSSRCRDQGLSKGSIQRPILRMAYEPRVLPTEFRPRCRPPCTDLKGHIFEALERLEDLRSTKAGNTAPL